MTDTVNSVTGDIIRVVKEVGGPLFTERGFVDVATKFAGIQNLGQMLEAFDFAEAICACPDVVKAAFHDLRTAAKRVLDASLGDPKKDELLSFARLQALHAASLFQDARNGRTSFEEAVH